MKVYELMNQLGLMRADQDVEIGVCLKISELTSGKQIDKDCFCLRLNIDDIDVESGNIGTSI